MIAEITLDGLPLRTGDIICTANGVEGSVAGGFWRAVGHFVPGEVDHVAIYVGPEGQCVEAGPRGVVLFELPGQHWDAQAMVDQRWLLDTLVGVAYPLAGRGLDPAAEERIRAAVAAYCLEQVYADKPYNVNFFDPATDAAFYCSQLIYRAYLEQGVDLLDGKEIARGGDNVPLILPQAIWQHCPEARRVAAQRTA